VVARFFWQLTAGEWKARAVIAGRLADAKIIVEDMTN